MKTMELREPDEFKGQDFRCRPWRRNRYGRSVVTKDVTPGVTVPNNSVRLLTEEEHLK